MTVEELIKELEKYPKDMIVTVPSTYMEHNIDEMEVSEVIIGELYKGVLIC